MDKFKLSYEEYGRAKAVKASKLKFTKEQMDSIGFWSANITLILFVIFMHFATRR